MSEDVCVWCDQRLIFDSNKGWVHEKTGEIYVKNPDGTDNHCALPKRNVR